ncbi:hypothetical protein [Allorhodopirellula solitaria]|nr:hypothetical protein [Allorhodopirellula solitaria]
MTRIEKACPAAGAAARQDMAGASDQRTIVISESYDCDLKIDVHQQTP